MDHLTTCVYIITNGRDEYKVGYTSDISTRLANLQTGNTSKLKVVQIWPSDKPKELERFIHDKLRVNRIRGEWFKLSPEWLSVILFEIETRERELYPDLFRNEGK